MKVFVVVSLACLSLLRPSTGEEKKEECAYARFSPSHTGCLSSGHQQQQRHPCSSTVVLRRNVTAHEVGSIVRTHNLLRQRVANGAQPGQPAASNMRQLSWDAELAFLAQTWADQCHRHNERDCDDCRRVERFPVGQNLRLWSARHHNHNPDRAPSSSAATGISTNSSITAAADDDSSINGTTAALVGGASPPAWVEADWEATVNSWFEAVQQFAGHTPALIRRYSFSLNYGTYTQLVWANTSLVGCGFSAFTENGVDKKLYVCNYGEAGNMVDEPVYEEGVACSGCPMDEGWKCSAQYPGLCAPAGAAVVNATE